MTNGDFDSSLRYYRSAVRNWCRDTKGISESDALVIALKICTIVWKRLLELGVLLPIEAGIVRAAEEAIVAHDRARDEAALVSRLCDALRGVCGGKRCDYSDMTNGPTGAIFDIEDGELSVRDGSEAVIQALLDSLDEIDFESESPHLKILAESAGGIWLDAKESASVLLMVTDVMK